MSCGAAVGAVLLLEVAAAGIDGRERVVYVVSLTLFVLLVSALSVSKECERCSVTFRYVVF